MVHWQFEDPVRIISHKFVQFEIRVHTGRHDDHLSSYRSPQTIIGDPGHAPCVRLLPLFVRARCGKAKLGFAFVLQLQSRLSNQCLSASPPDFAIVLSILSVLLGHYVLYCNKWHF